MNGEREFSLVVVGIDYANADGSNRRAELARCQPGDRVELQPDLANEHDELAVAVFSERGVQLGYVRAVRAPWVRARILDGTPVLAIFQGMLDTAGVIRARFGGGDPTLPGAGAGAAAAPPAYRTRSREAEFYPDPPGPMWGA